MKRELLNKVRAYGKLEDEIYDLLSKLPRWADDCNCKNKNYKATIKLVYEGDFDEITTFCLECGGVVWDRQN